MERKEKHKDVCTQQKIIISDFLNLTLRTKVWNRL